MLNKLFTREDQRSLNQPEITPQYKDEACSDSWSLFCENWIVDRDGSCQPYYPKEDLTFPEPYRLYRFLTDLEIVLNSIQEEAQIIKAMMPLVRQLLISCDWLHENYITPNLQSGWSVKMLYQEPGYPITVQTTAWIPGQISSVHNHATWGIVAVISGQEKNTFWRKIVDPEYPNQLEKVDEKVLIPGDIISFTSEAIHCVESLGDEPTVTFNLYGITDFNQRYEFNLIDHTAKNF